MVTDRNAVQSGRIAAALLWAMVKTNRDSLLIRDRAFDERFGSTAIRESIQGGADPDEAMDRQRSAVMSFLQSAARFRLYP